MMIRWLLLAAIALTPMHAIADWTNQSVVPNVSFTAAGDANVTGVVAGDYSCSQSGVTLFVSVWMTGTLSEPSNELYVNIPCDMRAARVHKSGGVNILSGGFDEAGEWSTAGTQIVVRRMNGGNFATGTIAIRFVIMFDAIPRTTPPPPGDGDL